MRIIHCDEARFRRDFMPLIIELWYNDKHDPTNAQHLAWLDKKIHVTFENFSTVTAIYTDDDVPMGYLWYYYDPGPAGVGCAGKYAHILQLGLYPAYQRQGAGSQLMAAVCRELQAQGAECLYTDTYTDNVGGMVFYIKSGFLPVGLLPGLNGIHDDGQVYLYKVLV